MKKLYYSIDLGICSLVPESLDGSKTINLYAILGDELVLINSYDIDLEDDSKKEIEMAIDQKTHEDTDSDDFSQKMIDVIGNKTSSDFEYILI